MQKKISIEEAATLWLTGFGNKSAFFDSQLISFIYDIRETKSFRDYSIKGLRKDSNIKRKFLEITDYLVSNDLVRKKQHSYFIINNRNSDELEVLCSLYNIGYVSYLSAMRFYNLTNRLPKKIDYIAPSRAIWSKMQKRAVLSDSQTSISYPSENIVINKKHLNVFSRSRLYEPRRKGENVRIIDIGDLFLEMVRHPDLCGGFQHIFEIYEEMADALLDEIIASVEAHGNAIDRVRIGFIIDSHLKIEDERIIEWKKNYTSRGGSRKMISNEPYSNVYNDEWCISLNHSIFA